MGKKKQFIYILHIFLRNLPLFKKNYESFDVLEYPFGVKYRRLYVIIQIIRVIYENTP